MPGLRKTTWLSFSNPKILLTLYMYQLSSSSWSVIMIYRSYKRNASSARNSSAQAHYFSKSTDGRAISDLCSPTTVFCSTSCSRFFFGRPGLGPSLTCTSRITGLFRSRPRSIARSMMLWTVLGWIPVSRWISWFDTPSSLRVRAWALVAISWGGMVLSFRCTYIRFLVKSCRIWVYR